jgi:hypothetical protein
LADRRRDAYELGGSSSGAKVRFSAVMREVREDLARNGF